MRVEKLNIGVFQTNCYILSDDSLKTAIIIDVPAEPTTILSYLASNQLNLKAILLTHGHCDHIMGADLLRQATNAPIYIQEQDHEMIESVAINMSDRFTGGPVSFKADVKLKDNEILDFEFVTVKVIHTPGHTKGSVSYLIGDRCYSGDTLFHESVGRTDLYGGSTKVLTESIKNRLFTLPDETRVYPGHGLKTTIKHEKRNNPFVR